ncbi:hypothetical protein [Polaromonas sp.]|uniref:hypothetical protein n=1 Tax=Polaromonas sp. TaxID=1869339 RepID=UPI00352B913E
MDNATYDPLFAAFAVPARERLTELAGLLTARFGHEFTPVEEVDHDIERGMCFARKEDPTLFVELMLTDGDERGFEGAGLLMTCSTRLSGLVWVPFNFSEKVGTNDPVEIKRRLDVLGTEMSVIAEHIQVEWLEIETEATQPQQMQS